MIQPVQKRSPQFARLGVPPLVYLEERHAWNRLAIETLGYYSWSAALSRSKFELMEIGLDWLGWAVVGVALPLTLGKWMKGKAQSKILKACGNSLPSLKDKKLTMLEVPFEFLDQSKSMKTDIVNADPIAKGLGFKDVSHLQGTLSRNPKLVELIQNWKVGILGLDLFLFAIKGQLYNWGSKWLTEKLSGKKGFSGEFNQASDEYLKKKSNSFDLAKNKRKIFSFVWGFGGALALPLLMMKALKSPGKLGTGFLGRFKKLMPYFNYVDGIYMSKWVILWHNIFNFATPTILSARDPHELREKATKMLAFDIFYFFGDDWFTGAMAKFLQNRPGFKKQLGGIKLIRDQKGILGRPVAFRLNEMYKKLGGNANHIAYKLSRWSFLFGFAMTTLFLGIGSNLANNLYTQKKVKEEMSALQKQQRHKTHTPKPFPKIYPYVSPQVYLPTQATYPFQQPQPYFA